MYVIWTNEQVDGLAPTNHVLKTSRGFAMAEKWQAVGNNDQAVWGLYPATKVKAPIQTVISIERLAFFCSCASRRFPCAHGLALLQLLIEQPAIFAAASMPEWAVDWQHAYQKRTKLQQQRATAVPPPHQSQKRLTAIQAGLAELELWLHDMVRNGLAAARHKPKTYWFKMADRMVDAKANGVSAELRQLAAIPTDKADWAETVLRRIGRLYLLVQGFHHFDALTPEIQADLQTAVGWQPRGRDEAPGVRDRWHILGQETEPLGRRQIQRTWLWGEQTNRAAQIHRIIYGQRYKDFSLMTGTILDAELRFYTSASPLRAQIVERFGCCQPDKPVAGFDSIQAAITEFNQALSANPWLNQFPMMLTAVPAYEGTHWLLYDESGANLLLPAHYKHNWHLLALSRGRPLPVFGVYDGRTLTPLSVWSDARYLPLHILRGVA